MLLFSIKALHAQQAIWTIKCNVDCVLFLNHEYWGEISADKENTVPLEKGTHSLIFKVSKHGSVIKKESLTIEDQKEGVLGILSLFGNNDQLGGTKGSTGILETDHPSVQFENRLLLTKCKEYEDIHKQYPNLKGVVTISIKIDKFGKVRHAEIDQTESNIKTPTIQEKVLACVKRYEYNYANCPSLISGQVQFIFQ